MEIRITMPFVYPIGAVDLTTEPVLAGIAALAAVALLAVWVIPKRQARRWKDAGIKGKDLVELENAARGSLVQLLGGVALILTFVATWLQIADTRDATDRTLRLTSAQQETEQFTSAVEQLGAARPEVRLGGIYSLERVMRDSPRQQRPVAQLMLAYLHSHHPLRKDDSRLRGFAVRVQPFVGRSFSNACANTFVRAWSDTQSALDVVLKVPEVARPRLDFRRTDLIGIRAAGANFSHAIFRDAVLAGGQFEGARFDRASFSRANLTGACFRGAEFGLAALEGADLTGADLRGADLSRATILGSHEERAYTDACTRLPWRRRVPSRCKLRSQR